ncbi:MAG: LysR family transcriptional regulator [Myxococcales bacterium]|nr:LysR family transcriptional regulator [Myxococcales bacterium]HRC54274.1 LysR family transcriptional regulator [Kofleriaceae bacterium]
MDLNEILVFTRVVETKSFTGAAEVLGLPKSTVSRKLAQLEERLGVRLLQRTTRKLALTDAGQVYYERCARIVSDAAAAEKLVTDMQAAPRGMLKVTAPVDLSTTYLGPVLSRFCSEHPEISVELDASDRVVDLIEDGFDVAIRFGPLQESTFAARRLCRVHMQLWAAPSYLARRPAPQSIDELDEHDRVLFTPITRMQSWDLDGPSGESYEFARPARFASNNLAAVRAVVIEGGGIGILPDFFVPEAVQRGQLERVLPQWEGRVTEFFAVYPGRQNLPPKLQLFLEHMTRSFNPPPWTL